MSDIQDYIQKLGDDSFSFEEQAVVLQKIEQSLLETQSKQEEIVQSSTDLVIEAVKSIEDTVYTQFRELSTSESMKGPKGDKGKDGKDGKNGKDGVGYNGKDGKDGVDGVNGEDGRYITDIEVAIDDTLLVTLSDNTTIKTTKEIKGPKGDMGPQGLRGSNGNGVVVGGTTGQVLAKASATDYDVTWTNTPGIDLGSPDAIGDVNPNSGTFTLISSTRINPRVTNITSSSTITPPSDTADQYSVTALAVPATIAIPSGTPVAGQKLTIRIKDDGTARALTWTTSAGGYRVIGSTLPTTTVINKTVYVGCIYNSTESFWDVVAVAQQV